MPNLAPTIDQRLLPAQARVLRLAASASERHGVGLFLVGGSVRDILKGHETIDLDLSAVGGTPELASLLARELEGEVVARSQFGTSKLKIGDTAIDLAAARKESYANPGALPTVVPGSIEEDLARRDFSINAMAISLAEASWGELLDPFDGRADLQEGLIRVLHSESFIDDATRVLRAVRYADRLGFRLETITKDLLRRDLSYLDTIKGDRIRHELERIFREDRSGSMLELAQELGVLSAVYPPLRIDGAALRKIHRLRTELEAEKDLLLVSLFAYSVPVGDLPGLIARLNMDTRWARVVRDTGSVRGAFGEFREPDLRASQLYGLLHRFDITAVRGCALASEDPVVVQRLEWYDRELRRVKTALNGDDLIVLGMPQGPKVGKLLEALLAARLDGLITTRQDEESFVARRLQEGLI